MKKQIIIIIITSFIIIMLIVFFVVKQNGQDKQQISQEKTIKLLCSYNSDEESYKKVIETSNKEICKCIKDEKLKNTCMDLISDGNFYKKATNDLNQDLCANIKDEITKESCILAVQDGVKYMESIKKPDIEIKNMTVKDYEKIQQENPNNVDNLINLAMAYGLENFGKKTDQIDIDKINKALLILETAKKLEPDNSKVYSTEGYIYRINSQWDKSLIFYGKSIELNANNIEALINRAQIYNFLKMYKEAINDFERAYLLDKYKIYRKMIIDIELCKLYANNSNPEKAKEKCNQVINNNENELFKKEAKKILESLQ